MESLISIRKLSAIISQIFSLPFSHLPSSGLCMVPSYFSLVFFNTSSLYDVFLVISLGLNSTSLILSSTTSNVIFKLIFYHHLFSLSPYPLFHLRHPLPPTITTLLSVSMNFLSLSFFLFRSSPPCPLPLTPPPSLELLAFSLLCNYEAISIFLASSICSLDATYE